MINPNESPNEIGEMKIINNLLVTFSGFFIEHQVAQAVNYCAFASPTDTEHKIDHNSLW